MGVGYNPKIVTDGLVLALDAANVKSYPGSGTTWADLSGNRLDATLTNNPTYSSNIFTFNRTNLQYAVIPYTATLAPTAGLTASAWAKTDWQTSNAMRILSKTQAGGYNIAVNDSAYVGFLSFVVHVGGAYIEAKISKTSLTTGWHNIVGTCDGRYVNLYIDSILVDTYDRGSTAALTYTATRFIVGAEPGGGTAVDGVYFDGDIAQVSVYNRALTPEEIQQNFNALRGRFGI